MNLSTLLKDYAVFNHWANTQIVEWLRTKPAADMDREIPSSFPSLRLTLLHIWTAEDLWLLRLQGGFPTDFISQDFKGTLDDVFNGVLRRSAELRDFLLAQEIDFFHQQHYYKDVAGNPFTNYRAEMIQHCIQHSTFHRGQIVTIARNLGHTDVPRTDFIFYVRTKDA